MSLSFSRIPALKKLKLDKDRIKSFFSLSYEKTAVILMLFLLSLPLGFIETSSCYSNSDSIEQCKICGIEGIYNPLLRPVTFFIENIFRGLIWNQDFTPCHADYAWFVYIIFDVLYWFIAATIILEKYARYQRMKKYRF